MSIKPQSFSMRLNAYFERYSTTTQILQALLKQEAAPQDFIVLACARLDSLANHAIPGELSQSDKFSRFLDEHSGHGEVLSSVSVGDLYSSFLVELWQLPGVIELPGRLRMFDEVKQRDFIDLYWKSELALAEDDLEGLMDFVLMQLRTRYRVIPHQSCAKRYSDSPGNIQRALENSSVTVAGGRYKSAMTALKPILKAHQLAAILYRDYRNGSIHGAGVDLDEDEFFEAETPYWSPVEYVFASVKPVFQITFPAKLLLSVYQNCVDGFQKKLLATRKLPISIFNQMFPGNITRHLEYLDQTSVQEAVELRPK